jgi:protein-tyrosine kinase
VSRIEEALRRSRGDRAAAPTTVEAPQEAFTPAWPAVHPTDDGGEQEVSENGRRLAGHVDVTASAGAALVSFSSQWKERLATQEGDPVLVEQFRRLAATLQHAQGSSGLRSVMITSAAPGDGKTLTAVNLALVLAESYRARVLLIDADLRRPSIPTVVDLGDGAGLSDALRAQTEQKLMLVQVTPRLTLLPAGQPIANSIEALSSPRMRQILDEAVSRFDWVILDAPPIGPTADASLLTEMVHGTLFVIHAGQTQCPDVQKALDSLGREHVLGVVLNGVDSLPSHAYYGMPRSESGT